jgi:hypothetical protein
LRKLIANVLIPIILILTVFAPLTIGNTSVFAEGVGVVLSSSHSSIEAGGSFSITASATTQLPIGNYVVEITYDPNLVRYDGFSDLVGMSDPRANASSGKVRVVAVGSEVTAASLCKFNFTALTPGSSAITVSYAEVASEFPPAGSSASISIIPPKSGNANLASLAVDQGTLRPSFSPGTQNYTLPVAMGVSEINITAKAEDSKALSVQVSGNTGLRDGANTIKIVVTAQNGSTKTYTITANRTGPTPTPAPTPTPEPTPTPPPSVDVDGSAFSIVELPEEVEVPAGFYEAAIEINGNMVTAWKSTRGGMILLYLSNEGPESGFYFYDEESGSFYRFAQLTVPGALFTRIPAEENIELPEGFVEARITIDGEHFDCWRYYSEDDEENESDLYLLYLMSEQGDKGFYLYQKSTRLIFPYEATKIKADPTPTPIPTPEATPTPVPEPESESPFANPFFISTLILAAITAILTGLLVWLTVRNRSGGGPKGPTDPDSDGMFQENVHVKPPKIRRVD